MPATTPIVLEEVSRTYGSASAPVHAVREVSVSIERGQLVSIVGTSGSGKSTLLNLIGALDTPTRGQVIIDGSDLSQLEDRARTLLRREKIGFVFQFFNLLPTLTAAENVALPATLAGRPRNELRERADTLLQRVGLGERRGHLPDQLSGGEMQRVAIARALMMDPPILLADEPTGNLDSATGEIILELLRGAAEAHRTVVLVTHDPHVARQGDRMLTMNDGRVVEDRNLASAPAFQRDKSPASA